MNKLLELIATDGAHHPMSPSSAERWMTCAASVRENAFLPDTTSDAAAEGTLAHSLAETCLLTGNDTKDVYGYDEEMHHYVQQYVDYVRNVARNNKIYVEQRISLSDFYPRGMGTADAIIIDAENDTLHVIDLKYGKGVRVSAVQNKQAMLYGLGALVKASKAFHITNIVLHIVQPRLDNFDKWEISASDLLAFGDQVKIAADLCLTDDAPYKPEDKACLWCKAKATCPALYEHTVAVVGEDFAPLAPAAMTDEQLKLVIDNKGLIEKWLKAVESHVFDRLEHGGSFEGYKMVEGRSIRKWANDAEEKLSKMLGDNAYEKKLIGITTAEKLIGKKQLSEMGITVKPAGKPTLVDASDKRQAISVADDFEKLN